ncbi:hypothetical protein Ahy_B08g092813 [Arachis hypogaea]|uniref:Aminotransferase-like plant mobile domain-containing protein n=1 Tax=Arachis hypogaea TaxID=3818 RepID=A0A444Y4J6_ARAHY|nr:hypothetical protein Ahy_B08g092813 [Arachis hypogaea]
MAGSSSHATTQDKGKGHVIAPPSPPTLRILNQINDKIIDDLHLQINDTRILIPFTIGADTHCFLGPIETLDRENKKLSFFPNAEGEDLLINQVFNISHFINQKPFRNNPKINPRGFNFTTWYQCLEPTKSAIWGALGIHELLRLSHFSLTTYPWMIGAVTCFWNRTTNNFHLSCGMIGMSLLDVAAITRLPINSPDCTPEMQSKHQYNIFFNTSYSEFIAHNMGEDGTEIIDSEHLFLPLAALLHEGKALNLAKLLLGHIFEELGQFVCDLRDNRIINTGGPLWLLQLWLNTIFENLTKPEGGSTDKQYIEGFRLSNYKPNFPNTQSDEDRFWAVFSLFHSCKDFDNDQLNFTHFLCCNRGPAWLDRLLFPNTNEKNELANQTWANLLAVQLVLPSSSESADESKPTNKDNLAASSQSEDAADSDPGSQLVRRSRLPQVIDPTTNPLQHSPEETHILESISPNNQDAFSAGNLVVPDSDSASKDADTTNSDSSRSKVLETPPELQPSSSLQANLQTPHGPRPGTASASTTPISASLDNLIFVLNKVVQENKIPVPVPAISRPATSRPLIELDPDAREQLQSLIKLLDHPPTTWVNDLILYKLLADLLNSSFELPTNTPHSASIQEFKQLLNESVASQFQLQEIENEEATSISNIENCLATAQPIQASREEFDLRISHAIFVQAFHDQEKVRLEAELIQIQEQLATIRQSRATIAKPLAIAQQDQHHLIQEHVSIDTKQGEYEKKT